jgi:hypothetical protein
VLVADDIQGFRHTDALLDLALVAHLLRRVTRSPASEWLLVQTCYRPNEKTPLIQINRF